MTKASAEFESQKQLEISVLKKTISEIKQRLDFSRVNWVDTAEGRIYTDLVRELNDREWRK